MTLRGPAIPLTVLLTTLVVVAGCRDYSVNAPTDPAERIEVAQIVALGDPFEIRPGQEVRVDTLGLTIRFSHVMSDDRCSTGTACGSRGTALLFMESQRDLGTKLQFVLSIPGGVGDAYYWGNVIQDREYTYRLLRLLPHPGSGTASDGYRAVVVVETQ